MLNRIRLDQITALRIWLKLIPDHHKIMGRINLTSGRRWPQKPNLSLISIMLGDDSLRGSDFLDMVCERKLDILRLGLEIVKSGGRMWMTLSLMVGIGMEVGVVRADLGCEMVEREGAKKSKARDLKAKQKIISE